MLGSHAGTQPCVECRRVAHGLGENDRKAWSRQARSASGWLAEHVDAAVAEQLAGRAWAALAGHLFDGKGRPRLPRRSEFTSLDGAARNAKSRAWQSITLRGRYHPGRRTVARPGRGGLPVSCGGGWSWGTTCAGCTSCIWAWSCPPGPHRAVPDFDARRGPAGRGRLGRVQPRGRRRRRCRGDRRAAGSRITGRPLRRRNHPSGEGAGKTGPATSKNPPRTTVPGLLFRKPSNYRR
jgi:hypothetical protein